MNCPSLEAKAELQMTDEIWRNHGTERMRQKLFVFESGVLVN